MRNTAEGAGADSGTQGKDSYGWESGRSIEFGEKTQGVAQKEAPAEAVETGKNSIQGKTATSFSRRELH